MPDNNQSHITPIQRWKDGELHPPTDDALAIEEPLEIRVRGQNVAVTMRTPGHDEELAAGFLATEGLIKRREDVTEIAHCTEGEAARLGNTLNVFLGAGVDADLESLTRHVFASSSCGLCGKATIEAVQQDFPPVDSGVRIAPDIITGLPAHDDHLGGRLRIGPDEKLYLSIGDQGGNWLHNFCNPNLAQALPTAAQVQAGDWTTYEGTILRLNLDGSIPDDNPTIDGVRSHILSYGHRNPQGLAFGDDGRLYASEHGPSTDDELNLIRAGGNYGWPDVAGYRDEQMYVYANWSASSSAPCDSLSFSQSEVPASVPQQTETAWSHPDFRPPLQTLFTVPSDYDFDTQGGATIAPSSLAIYTTAEGGIPGWANSLLVPGLIKGRMYRQPLSADGTTAAGEPIELLRTTNRYRDLELHPNGRTIYVATDSSGRTTGADDAMTQALEHPGAIIQFTYGGRP